MEKIVTLILISITIGSLFSQDVEENTQNSQNIYNNSLEIPYTLPKEKSIEISDFKSPKNSITLLNILDSVNNGSEELSKILSSKINFNLEISKLNWLNNLNIQSIIQNSLRDIIQTNK